MQLVGKLLYYALEIYFWIIIASVAISWLIIFGVFNANRPEAKRVIELLNRMTEPVYKPLRKFIPPVGGFDLTPLVVIIAVALAQSLVVKIFNLHLALL